MTHEPSDSQQFADTVQGEAQAETGRWLAEGEFRSAPDGEVTGRNQHRHGVQIGKLQPADVDRDMRRRGDGLVKRRVERCLVLTCRSTGQRQPQAAGSVLHRRDLEGPAAPAPAVPAEPERQRHDPSREEPSEKQSILPVTGCQVAFLLDAPEPFETEGLQPRRCPPHAARQKIDGGAEMADDWGIEAGAIAHDPSLALFGAE